MKKKVLVTMMTVAMMIAFAACGTSEKESVSQPSVSVVETTASVEVQEASQAVVEVSEDEVLVADTVEESLDLSTYEDDLYIAELDRVHVGGNGLGALTFYVENHSTDEYSFGFDGVLSIQNENGEWEQLDNVTTTGATVASGEGMDVEVSIASDEVIGNGYYMIKVNGMEYDFVVDSYEE